AGTGGGNDHSYMVGDSQPTYESGTPPVISADGRYVAFDSNATNLVPVTVPVSGENVYLRDLKAGTTTLASAKASGAGPGGSSGAVISPDGRYVAFESSSSLLAQDTNGHTDAYVYTIATGTLALASLNQAGTNGGNGNSGFTTGTDGDHGGL